MICFNHRPDCAPLSRFVVAAAVFRCFYIFVCACAFLGGGCIGGGGGGCFVFL
jgi:hypothetical protein